MKPSKLSESSIKLSSNPSDLPLDVNEAKHRRLGWLVLLFGIGGFFIWAGFAPLDQGVGAPGIVVVSGNRKAVQPLVGGKVADILIKDGDVVKKGQLLVKLDDTQAKSQLDIAKSQWMNSSAIQARLIAERDDKNQVDFPGLLGKNDEARITAILNSQRQLFDARRKNLHGELSVLAETLAGMEAQLAGLEASKNAKDEQLKILNEEIRGQRELANEGYLPRNRLLEQERLLSQLGGALSEDIGNIGRTKRGIAEIRARMSARQREYLKEVESQLAEVQRDTINFASRVEAFDFELRNTEIVAPADGVVVGLSIHTVGGVVQAGMLLMDVVPQNEPLRIDAQIPTHLIDKVKRDLDVDILFPAFNQKTTPKVQGKLVSVSADVLTEPKQGFPYYKAQVVVTNEGMRALNNNQIKAGMPAEVFIKTGERTMLNYLVKPLTDRLHNSLNEE